ncbi:alpha/beta hydrolase domain-containing protein [Comamonas sediminis]|uniref:alpha/beta hydrolase domain-containing protein n=1 Tax=Comamonas sediminis TaxID=1783360 RepID=UPI003D2CC76D
MADTASGSAVTKFYVTSKVSPAFDGRSYGAAGQYEIINAIAEVEVDPADPRNALITDIALAPRNERGRISYATTVSIAKPIDAAKSSGYMFHLNSNRGTTTFSPTGNEAGDIGVMIGWQAELPASAAVRVTSAPVAKNADGSEITGVALARMADMPAGIQTQNLQILGYEIPYDAVLDKSKARLIRKTSETRAGQNGATEEIPQTAWEFADCSVSAFPGKPDPRKLCLRDGFDSKYLYELTYQVKNPIVLGIGAAAVRDVASFLRYDNTASDGSVNPVAGLIKFASIQGISQSGNFLKTWINLGFNEDLRGRKVFDGAQPWVAGRQSPINLRFGVPSGSGTLYEPGGEGVLWWAPQSDSVRGRAAQGLLGRCNSSNTCPKIIETFGAAEFTGRLVSVALVGTDNAADLALPDNVRRYYFPGTTHAGGTGGFTLPATPTGKCALAANPNPEEEQQAAVLLALKQWVMQGTEPPPSMYPTLQTGTLAPAEARSVGFPSIPGAPSLDGLAIPLIDYNFGNLLSYNDLSGQMTIQPPAIRRVIAPLLPRVDQDGNEISGYPSVLHQAPLGTYTGWNPTATGWFVGQACGGGLTGGFIPFAKTKVDRIAVGDPRPSLEERYGSRTGYICAVKKAVEREKKRRMLLAADAEKLIAQASAISFLPDNPDTSDAVAATARNCSP